MTELVFYLMVFLVVGVFFLFFHLMIGKLFRPAKPDADKLTIYECGEPTIGSAWIQFDLRFYVVALLFVIFDVEVAFFFPWATVFGKANELTKLDQELASLRDKYQHESDPDKVDRLSKQIKELEKKILEKSGDLAPGPRKFPQANRSTGQPPAGVPGGGAPPPGGPPGGLPPPGGGQGPRPAGPPAGGGGGGPPGPPPQAGGPTMPTVRPAPALTPPKEVASRIEASKINGETAKKLAWLSFWDILIFFGVLLVGFMYLWKRGDLDWVRSTAAERATAAPNPGTGAVGAGPGS